MIGVTTVASRCTGTALQMGASRHVVKKAEQVSYIQYDISLEIYNYVQVPQMITTYYTI